MMLMNITTMGTNALATWLKLTETQRSEVFPMAMFSEKMTENSTMDRRLLPSICFGFTDLQREIDDEKNARKYKERVFHLEKKK